MSEIIPFIKNTESLKVLFYLCKKQIMESVKKIGYDVDEIIGTFDLVIKEECTILENWLSARYDFTPFEQKIIEDLAVEIISNIVHFNS